ALAGSALLSALKRYGRAHILTHDQVVSPPERLTALKEGAATAGLLGALETARRIGQQIEAGRVARGATHTLLQAWGLPTLHDSFKTLGLIDLLEVQEQRAVAAWQQEHLPPLGDRQNVAPLPPDQHFAERQASGRRSARRRGSSVRGGGDAASSDETAEAAAAGGGAAGAGAPLEVPGGIHTQLRALGTDTALQRTLREQVRVRTLAFEHLRQPVRQAALEAGPRERGLGGLLEQAQLTGQEVMQERLAHRRTQQHLRREAQKVAERAADEANGGRHAAPAHSDTPGSSATSSSAIRATRQGKART